MSKLEFADYIRRPKINPASGLALAIRLLQSAPKQALPEQVVRALLDLREAAEALQDALRTQHTLDSSSLRPYDRRFDGSWAALYTRLHAWTRHIDHPMGARAQALLTKLFPTKLAFLKFSYDEEWIHSRTLLALVEEEGLEAELDKLAGEGFLELVELAHTRLGEVLGFDDQGELVEATAPDVVAHTRAVAQAIATYGRRMVGIVDEHEHEPASVAMFEAALAPRTAHLQRVGKRSSAARVGGLEQGQEVEEVDAEPELDDLDLDALDLDAPLPELEL